MYPYVPAPMPFAFCAYVRVPSIVHTICLCSVRQRTGYARRVKIPLHTACGGRITAREENIKTHINEDSILWEMAEIMRFSNIQYVRAYLFIYIYIDICCVLCIVLVHNAMRNKNVHHTHASVSVDWCSGADHFDEIEGIMAVDWMLTWLMGDAVMRHQCTRTVHNNKRR